eukprot:TRINITY_DN5691_c0_g1_i2.p1 TRINITY_DN5691_c0_g1~~TRINITY_DN5691_c0_g1_i2.p1  ORF type:complete len:341 (+),score=50.05 TRINITY_DN5691_c0_g1_i2:86-1108(+)
MSSNKRQRTNDSEDKSEGKDVKHTTSNEFLRLMVRTKVMDMQPPSGIVFVCQRTSNVIDVWKGLIRHNFLSVPVLQKTGEKYYGFIDIADIVRYVVEYFGEKRLNQQDLDFWELAGKEEPFKGKTINDLMVYPIGKRNPFHPVHRNFSLFHAFELLARSPDLHRIPVVDDNRKLVNLITQSQMISFINANLPILGDKKNKPLSQCLHSKKVITIAETKAALDAFTLMTENSLSGLPVVNSDGKLVGNISLRDLKAIREDGHMFWRLYQSVSTFLMRVKNEFYKDRPNSLVTVAEDNTLQDAITKMAEHKIHRVYIVDSNDKPLYVITISEVMEELLKLDG